MESIFLDSGLWQIRISNLVCEHQAKIFLWALKLVLIWILHLLSTLRYFFCYMLFLEELHMVYVNSKKSLCSLNSYSTSYLKFPLKCKTLMSLRQLFHLVSHSTESLSFCSPVWFLNFPCVPTYGGEGKRKAIQKSIFARLPH